MLLAVEQHPGLVHLVSTVEGRLRPGAGWADLFAPGSATINPRFESVLDRIAAALNEVPGPVLIVGHSDSQPIRSFRYQNNFELSSDRALSVLRRLETTVSVPARLQSNGVGSTQPRYVPDDTAENRAKNRRVEIVHVFSGEATP